MTTCVDVDRSMSLIERKKQQWAREREELAGLCAPWGAVRESSFEDQLSRKRIISNSSSINNSAYARKETNITPRRSSLPPLYKNQYNSTDRYEREKDFGGETSGYGSDNPHVPEYPKSSNPNWHQNGYESSSSYREDRPKWGDRGVAVGNKFWGSRENLSYGKVATNDPPGWVKRGLENDTQIVVTNSSPAESPQQDCGESERPSTNSSSNLQNRSYIRGQNVPIDHLEIMERERRRQAALAHQEAIRKQLEEREQRRKEEKERRIKEEREEELRIEKEQEIERKRREQELRAKEEKQEREQKRKQAIQEAIELAEKEAKIEKMKQRLTKQNNINLSECVVEKDKVPSPKEDYNNAKINASKSETNSETSTSSNITKINNLDQQNNNLISSKRDKSDNDDNQNQACSQKIISPRELNNDKDSMLNKNNSNLNTNDIRIPSPKQANTNNYNINNPMVFSPQFTPRIENVALLLQPPLDSYQNMQYAVLVPNINPTTHTAIPIAVPIPITTDRNLYTAQTENRILTPTPYRNAKTFCDSSTQTDYIDFGRLDTSETNRGRFITEKMNTLELNYDNRSRNKERRSSRNEDRSREERPKWGANRPPTRYMKQSEKDPLYQRRKMRQKMRENKMYEDKNSSDESQTGSPRTYRKKVYVEKRNARALWRKHDQIFARNNMKMYQTEIIPLEADKDQIYYKQSCDRECCCHCRCSKKLQEPKVDILKIEHNSPRDSARQRPDLLPPDFNENAIDENTFIDTSEQFSSLNNDMLSQQDGWENSSLRSPNLSASLRYHENL